jgi:hypothetical protein
LCHRGYSFPFFVLMWLLLTSCRRRRRGWSCCWRTARSIFALGITKYLYYCIYWIVDIDTYGGSTVQGIF